MVAAMHFFFSRELNYWVNETTACSVRKAYVGERGKIEDFHLAKCSNLYFAVFNIVHSYILCGLNFVGSPGHEIYAPQKIDTQNLCPMKISTIMVATFSCMASVHVCAFSYIFFTMK